MKKGTITTLIGIGIIAYLFFKMGAWNTFINHLKTIKALVVKRERNTEGIYKKKADYYPYDLEDLRGD